MSKKNTGKPGVSQPGAPVSNLVSHASESTSSQTGGTGSVPLPAPTAPSPFLRKIGPKKLVAILVSLALLAGGAYLYRSPNLANIAPGFIAKMMNLTPTVVAGNFSLEYKKIPYNVPSIDITFSRDIDANTINANSVRMFPFVPGTASLKGPRTVSYALGSKLDIGTTYLLQFTTDIASTQGKKLDSEISYEIQAIGGVVVSKMIPDGGTVSLSKNPLFVFNIPVVPLGSLEQRDKLPCPVTFEPAVKGRCTWPSGNILEYRLDGNLDASTRYQAKIDLGPEFLFPLEKTFTCSFVTTPLRLLTGSVDESGAQRFSPKNGIPLVFTAPVDQLELSKAIVLKNGQGNVVPHRIVSSASGETVSQGFSIVGEKWPLPFATNFTVSIASGLMPKPGNIPLKDPVEFRAVSNAFVSQANWMKTEWSATGGLADVISIGQYYVPPNKPLLNLSLDEPVNFASLWKNTVNAVKLRETKWGKEYPCLLTQPEDLAPESPDSLKMVKKPNQQRLDCQFNTALPFATGFELVLDTSLTPSLSEPVKMPYETPKEFEIYDIVLKKATEACIYATSNINYTGSGVTIAPQAKIRDITDNVENYDYGSNTSHKTCEEKSWQVASVAEVRLNGKEKYDFAFDSDLRDIYGTPLKKPFSKRWLLAPALQKQDEYLYFMPEKSTQVIPLDAPVVLPIQSINLDSMNIQVCSMKPEAYATYLSEQYNNSYTPTCESNTVKKIPLKNGKWNLTTQKIDLAADVMGSGSVLGNILLVRGSADDKWKHDWPEIRDFQVAYLRSNLSLMLEQSEGKTIVFASDFDGKILPKDLKFEAYRTYSGCDTAWVKSLKFNEAKNYYESNAGSECAGLVVAKNDAYYGIVSSSTDQASNYDFGQYGWSDSTDRNYVYLHTDRPIYRTGDTVNFQGILRNFAATGYVKSSAKKIKIRVLNNQSELFKEFALDVNSHSNFEGSVELTEGMNTGRYSFEIMAYNAKSTDGDGYYVVNDGNFYVEQYSKPVFKTEVTGGQRHLYEGDVVEATAKATYYFGGNVANAPVAWNILAQNYYFDPKNYSEFRFGTDSSFMECRYWGNCSNHDEYIGNFTNSLDSAGSNVVKYTAELPKPEEEAGAAIVGTPDAKKERLVTFVAEVTDPNTGKVIAGSDSHIVHVTDGYVGVASPYWVDKGAKIPVSGVTLDVDSKARTAKVKLELIQLQWNMVKKLGVDGVYYDEYEQKKTLEATETVTSSADGKFKTELTPVLGGEYVVRASYTGKNGAAYVSDSYSYVATDSYSMWNSGNNSVTDLTAEKTLMQPGETAIFTLKSPVSSGKIFYSVEKDNTVLDAKVVDITGYGQKIEIPVLKTYIPNVYVRAYLIGRNDPAGLPVFKRALSQIRVLPDSKKLTVEVTAEKPKYLPGETLKVTVQVKDADGKPVSGAAGALAVVDESVLALLGNPEKNPFAFFYEMKRYLGTTVYVSLMNLVEKLEVKNAANGEKWGAGEGNKGGDTKKKRGIFKDTAYWTGDFYTDASGKAVIDTGKLPDNLTTWKIEAVIATDSTQVGAGRTSVTTEQKVMIQENFPRFLRTGDRTQFAPVVFNRTGKRQTFTVEMQAKGATVTPGKQEIALDDGKSVPVKFTVVGALDGSLSMGPVELSVTAKAGDGSEDGIQKTLVLSRGESYETTSFINTATGTSMDDQLDLTGVRDGGTLTFNASPSLLGNVLTGLDNLLQYPYGCLEQITSAVIPHIAVKNIHDSLKSPYDLKTVKIKYFDSSRGWWEERTIYDMMSDYVVRLMNYRLYNGGFGYWNSNVSYAEFELTAYAVSTLADIQALGVPVDQSLARDAVDYLKLRLEKNVREGCRGTDDECRYTTWEKVSAVTAIARWSTDGTDALKAYKALGNTNDTLANKLSTLLLVSRLTERKEISEAEKTELLTSAKTTIDGILKANLVYDPRGAYIAPEVGTSRTEATAKFVRALALLGEDSGPNGQILDNMSRFLSRAKKSDGSYGSTRETALVLNAFADRTKSDKSVFNANFQAKATLAGKLVFNRAFDSKNLLATASERFDIKSLTDHEAVNVGVSGVGKLYYDLTLRYPVPADKILSRDEGFFVETSYYDYLEYQKVEKAKEAEFDEYEQGKIRYSALKYPKEVREYVKPVTGAKVGQLIRADYRVILSEARDKVAFESFVPAGSELVNTRLATETKSVTSDTFFDREEIRDDRYFGYSEVLEAGEYSGSYALRFTHAGSFTVPSTRIFEFNTPEVFGQTAGKVMEVK